MSIAWALNTMFDVVQTVPIELSEQGAVIYDKATLKTYTLQLLVGSVLFGLITAVFSQLLERYILPFLGRRWMTRKKWEEGTGDVSAHQWRERFIANVTELLHHSFSFFLGVQIIFMFYTPWTSESFQCNTQYASRMLHMWYWPSLTADKVIAFLYIYQLGHYFYALIDITLLKSRKSDHRWMVTHHIATIALIFFSSYTCLRRSGLGIIVLFDAADIFIKFIHIGKCVDSDNIVKLSYVFLLPVFIVPRLGLLPYHLMRHIRFGGPHLPYEEVMWGFLGIITVCDILWAYIILKVGWRALRGKGIDDPRDKKEKAA